MLSCLAENLQPGCAILLWREKEGVSKGQLQSLTQRQWSESVQRLGGEVEQVLKAIQSLDWHKSAAKI